MSHLLIVDDDAHIVAALTERLAARGHEVATAGTAREALARIRGDRPDLVLLDLQLPDGDGLSLLQQLGAERIETTVVVITAFATVEHAVQAMKAGAYDFIAKPLAPALVEETVRRALERAELRRENSALRLARGEVEPVVVDPRTRAVFDLAAKAARSSATVLLLGESGAGKEAVAREVHRLGERAQGPFVAVNCGALSETLLESELFGHERGAFTGAVARRIGRIELAHRGTLFLDEIGDVTPAFQAKLLRVLQERAFERVGGSDTITVDVRVVAATHRDLKALVAAGRFREDLYYRLDVVSIRVPPLRERRLDIPPLVERFLAEASGDAHRPAPRLAEGVARALESYAWPGNVRELRNVIERAVVLLEGDEIGMDDLPEDIRRVGEGDTPGEFHRQVQDFRRRLIRDTLARCGGNQTRAAEALGLQRTYLARLVRQLGLQGPEGA